jgi:hypothetical protein
MGGGGASPEMAMLADFSASIARLAACGARVCDGGYRGQGTEEQRDKGTGNIGMLYSCWAESPVCYNDIRAGFYAGGY